MWVKMVDEHKRNLNFSAMQTKWILLTCTLLAVTCYVESKRYEPNWKSLDTRPLPQWYDDAKIGIFVHWGLFSVPSFGSEWFWSFWKQNNNTNYIEYMKKNYPPNFTYADFAKSFTADLYNPAEWAELFMSSGARYVVLTAKHHEGFANFKTKYSFNWNSVDVGPNRDLVGELAAGIRKYSNLHFGIYHSLFEWFHPLYLQDKANNFKTRDFAAHKSIPELYELVNQYKPDIVWSDGAAGPDTYWNSTEFIAWMYNDSPVKDTVVTNDRWGTAGCQHGDFWNCADKYNPGHLLKHKWENAFSIDTIAWGYIRNKDLGYCLSIEQIIYQLVSTVSCGGNILLNVGPRHDGKIPIIFEERLRQMGSWLNVNADAIYSSRPWTHQNDTVTPNIWYTSKKNTNTVSNDVYGILLKWPRPGKFHLGAPQPTQNTTVTFLGYKGPAFKWTKGQKGGIDISIPAVHIDDMPCQWAWTLKFTYLA